MKNPATLTGFIDQLVVAYFFVPLYVTVIYLDYSTSIKRKQMEVSL